MKERGEELPRFYLACGEQDFLLQPNRDFAAFLQAYGVDFCYFEGPGEHNFDYWNKHLEPGIQWILNKA